DVIDHYRDAQIAHLLAWAEHLATRHKTGATGFGSNAEIDSASLSRYGHVALDHVPGSPTIGELAAQPPAEFFARWVGIAHGFNRRRNQPPTTPRHILGTVAESEDLVHVVYRGVGWVPVVQIQIMSVARIDGQWLLVQNSDVVQAP